jgi:hypothetical protein
MMTNTSSQMTEDEWILDETLTSGYSCQSLYYININSMNSI